MGINKRLHTARMFGGTRLLTVSAPDPGPARQPAPPPAAAIAPAEEPAPPKRPEPARQGLLFD